ncbi:MAG: polysaccharide deacetylase [Oscillospiraceae bacterium]|nr:polysaccharide deacetylase [Oscillospiraceae bacterium]
MEQSPYIAIHEDMTVTPVSAEDMVREQGTVYLTFDDGPSQNTYTILSLLRKYDVKATFFVVPRRTDECYALLRAIVNDGHSIGVHSATHDYEKIYASVEAYLDDFYEAWDIVYDATGVRTPLFRFPGGSVNDFNGDTRDAIIEEMTRRGFRYYDWNVDSNDVGGATWSEMYNSIPSDIAQTYRSVVLMHDSAPRENTVYVLEDILKVLVGEGYKLDKINENTMPVQFTGPYE